MFAILFLLEYNVLCSKIENDQSIDKKIYSKASSSGYFGQLRYYFSNNKLELTGSGDMISNYGNKAPWNQFSSQIYYVSISSSITSIGIYGFAYTALKTLTLPYGIIRIEEYAFYDCTSLSEVNLPESLEFIGNNAFYNTNLTNIVIPEGVVTINSLAFAETKITSLFLPSTVSELVSLSFNYNPLSEIKVNENSEYYQSVDNVLYTKNKEFLIIYACLKDDVEFKIPDTVIGIDQYAFFNCSKLLTLTTSKKMEHINSCSFSSLSGLTNINIESEILTIGDHAFSSCINLISIKLPESVWRIEMYAFNNCKNLVSINLHDGIQYIESSAFYGCIKLESVYLPRDLRIIASGLFSRCKSITSINIPNNVETIGSMAFLGTGILEISIPLSVYKIESQAFEESALTKVFIPYNVEKIENYAFWRCRNLTSVTFNGIFNPEHDEDTFKECDNLVSVNVPLEYKSADFCGIEITKIDLSPNIFSCRFIDSKCYDCTSISSCLICDSGWRKYFDICAKELSYDSNNSQIVEIDLDDERFAYDNFVESILELYPNNFHLLSNDPDAIFSIFITKDRSIKEIDIPENNVTIQLELISN